MRAILNGHIIAESDDIEIGAGYKYFPASGRASGPSPEGAEDRSRPCLSAHVQFYDVVIDGVRYERAAWSYEAPRPSLQHVGGRFGFWHEVEVA